MSTPLGPHILNYLHHLKLDRPELEISVQKIRKTNKNYKHSNCFSLFIPYCTRILEWETCFSLVHPERIPTIITPHFNPNILTMRSFQEFDWTKSDSFSRIIQELLESYDLFQRKKIEHVENESVQFEYETLKNIKGLELSVSKDMEQVVFKIPLRFEGMEEFCRSNIKTDSSNQQIEKLIENDTSFLYLISAYDGEGIPPGSKIEVHFLLQEPMYISTLQLPHWTIGESCLFEYVKEVEKLLTSVVHKNVIQYKIRKEFMDTLNKEMKYFLYVDERQFFKASYLCNFANFRFFLFVTLTENFPQQKPVIEIQSIQHIHKKGNFGESFYPMKCKLKSLDYDPKSSSKVKVDLIITTIIQSLPEFKRICEKGK